MANTLSNTGGPMDWFNAMPKVSRFFAIGVVLTAAALSWDIPPSTNLLLDWNAVFRHGQVWRLVTHEIIVGGFSLHLLMNVVWILTYGAQLERTYEYNPHDFLFMFIFSTFVHTVISLLGWYTNWFLSSVASGTAMVMVLIYVWSKEFSEQTVTLYGVVKFKGFFLPMVFICIELLTGQSVVPGIIGIATGHTWYFLTVLLPRSTGKQYLVTPNLVKRLAQKLGLASPHVPVRNETSTSTGFKAFRGRGNRLNS